MTHLPDSSGSSNTPERFQSVNSAETSPMTLKELLESAHLDALGLLDEEESRAFERSFLSAPPAIQARIRSEQGRISASESMLPSIEAPSGLRERVLAGVAAAIALQAGQASTAEAAASQPGPSAVVQHASTREAAARAVLSDAMDVSGRRHRVAPAWRAAALGLLTACVVLGGSLIKVYSDSDRAMRSLTDQRSQESILALFGNSTQMRDVLFSTDTRRVIFTPVDDAPDAARAEAAVFVNPRWNTARIFVRGLSAGPNVSYRLVVLNSDNSIGRELTEIRSGGTLDTQQIDVAAAAPGTRLAIVLVAPGEPARADRVLMVATA